MARLWGRLWYEDGRAQVFHQSPGSVYIGNVCAVEHQVEHHGDSWPQTLCHDPEAGSASESPGLHVAVVLRCDVFRHSRARKLTGKPTLVDIYDLVNDAVAEHLATQPLTIPDFAAVARHAGDEDHGRRRRKRKGAP